MRIRMPSLKVASDEMLHLDFIRFVAAAGIVVHHSHEFFYSQPARTAIMARTAGLALFVDLFFLISGFVIAQVYGDRVTSLGDVARFLQRRVGRLVPLHWLTLLVSVAVWAVVATFVQAKHQPDFSPICIADTALLLQAIVPCGAIQFNFVTWSISAEMVMYLLFPLVAIVGARMKSAPLAAGIALFAVIFVFQYDYRLWHSPQWTHLPPY